MKKLLLGAISFLVLFSACKDDDNVNSNTTPPEETQLVTPEVRARIADPLNQNPFTGILEIYPCNAETSIYYGNFINGNVSRHQPLSQCAANIEKIPKKRQSVIPPRLLFPRPL